MGVLFERPLIIFLLAGLGAAILAVTGLIDALRKYRARVGGQLSEPKAANPRLRLGASLAVSTILGFVALQLLSAVATIAPRMAETLQLEGSPAPAMSYLQLDVEGRPTAHLKDLRGNVVLLNVWATWCPPCRREMPDLDRLQAKFGDRGLTVLHVSTERVEVLDGWLAEHTMSTHFGKIGSPPFPTPALPTSLVLDREGIVRHVLVGGTSYGRFEKAVEPWL